MQIIRITGKNKLNGEVCVNGSKNAALPVLAATILCEKPCVLKNIPHISDVSNMQSLLKSTGQYSLLSNHQYQCEMASEISHFASYDLANRLRASFLVAGPLVARTGYARVAYPGGCQIGERPVDLHLKGFSKLGISVAIQNGYVELKANKLKGNRIYLDFPSVGATENLMMAATLAHGTTMLENAAAEPEIVDLANFLNQMGADISGAGTDTIVIQGVSSLTGGEYEVIPDRIEAGTYMIAAAATGGKVKVSGVLPEHLNPLVAKLRETGTHITVGEREILVEGKSGYKAVDIKTMPHPGFPTDLQAQFCAMLAGAKGTSIITETIFENRFLHLPELKRLGAKITVEGRTAVIEGTNKLNGAQVRASDLRAAASLVIAGLMAEGTTTVEDNGYLLRGYSQLCENLKKLGAEIEVL